MSIQKVGVIGAGAMGSGIAQKIAQEGIYVIMVDIQDDYVQKGINSIKKTLSEGVKRGIFTNEQTEEILKRIRGTTNINEVKNTDLV